MIAGRGQRIARVLVSLGVAATFISVAGAYERVTHQQMSQVAVKKSKVALDSSLLADFGLSTMTVAAIENLVQAGAAAEDDTDGFFWRPFNHFFDPQNGGRGLTIAGVNVGRPSPLWALEDTSETMWNENAQLFSYRAGQQHLYDALTSSTPAARAERFAEMFGILGNVIHHVQDMAQPQHTRNDQHNEHINVDHGFYERYTAERFTSTEMMEQFVDQHLYVVSAGQTVPRLLTPRHYWYTVGASTPRYVGMAEYTSHNFLSSGTAFRVSGSPSCSGASTIQSLSVDGDYPLPSGFNVDGSPRRLLCNETAYIGGMARRVDYVIGKTFDGLNGFTSSERPMAIRSMLSGSTASYQLYVAASPLVFERNYDLLLPRAVAFSAGVIDHFFRARVDFKRNPSGSGWIIKNLSPAGQVLNGQFSVYYDNASYTRAPVAGASWTKIINPGVEEVVTFTEPPAGTTNLILVFRGRVGTDDPPVADTGFATAAGKVVAFTPPPVLCSSELRAEGSSAGLTELKELGDVAGPVKVEFEAYGIPDRLVVRRGSSSGQVLFDTGGLVSGFHTHTINHAPNGVDSTKVHVKVTGNADTNTWWTTTVGCPGQTIGNGDRAKPRVTLTFKYLPNGGAPYPSNCEAGYFVLRLNGTVVGNVYYGGGSSATSETVTAGPGHYYTWTKHITRNYTPVLGVNCYGGNLAWSSSNTSGDHIIGASSGYINIE